MNYPVICLKPEDSSIYWFADENSLKTADKELTEKGVFNNVSIIDSTGKCYSIKHVRIIRWATLFWGYSLKKPGRSVKIEFDLEDNGTISIDQLKERLFDKIDKSSFTQSEIEMNFTNVPSIAQVVNFFK